MLNVTVTVPLDSAENDISSSPEEVPKEFAGVLVPTKSVGLQVLNVNRPGLPDKSSTIPLVVRVPSLTAPAPPRVVTVPVESTVFRALELSANTFKNPITNDTQSNFLIQVYF